MCARFGRGSAVVVCACRCACRLDLANIHRHTHHSSRRWSCGATWSDMKRTCATCHEYSWHAPFVSSNSMVVVTNGGHSCCLELNGRVPIARARDTVSRGRLWGAVLAIVFDRCRHSHGLGARVCLRIGVVTATQVSICPQDFQIRSASILLRDTKRHSRRSFTDGASGR